MGFSFDDNGLFIGWSPFFNLTNIDTLHLSEQLPTPNGNLYSFGEASDSLDITSLMIGLSKDNFYKVESLLSIIDLLNAIDDYSGNTLYYDSDIIAEDTAKFILTRINEHNRYFIQDNSKLKKIYYKNIVPAFKNSVASKIAFIISDIKNTLAASTPINMDEPREASSTSALGKEAARVTGTSPSDKWRMIVLNMSGKQVIGITAVGEKIFFAASYYFNEAVKSGDPNWMNNALFNAVYDKIQSADMVDADGNVIIDEETGEPKKIKVTSVRNIIANVNFLINNLARNEWYDIILNVVTGELSNIQDISRTLQEQFGLQADLSLVISALLSAATDNAKELILDKINAGPDLAGMYLHLIMLNYSFQDISEFMTSPTVQTIKELAKTNIFDDYKDGGFSPIDEVVKALEKGPNIYKYLDKSTLAALFYFAKLKGIIDKSLSVNDYLKLLEKNYKDNKQLTTDIFPVDLLSNNNEKVLAYRFMDEYNYYIYKKQLVDFSTLESFKKIRKDAKETTLLGRVFGLNQGMKTDLAGKLSFLDTLEKIMNDAIADYNISSFVDDVISRKPYLSSEYVTKALEDALKLDIVSDFDIIKFLDTNNTEYREATINFYNCIKKVWNVYDMIDKIPHFKALYKVLGITESVDTAISNKYKIVKLVKKQLKEKGHKYFDENKLKLLIRAIDNLLISSWLLNKEIEFTLPKGSKYFYNGLRQEIKTESETFNLGTDDGRATFKLWMETEVIPQLKEGKINGKLRLDLMLNNFVQDLRRDERIDTFTLDTVNYYKLPINMLNIKVEADLANFAKYEEGLSKLGNVWLQNRSLLDWMFIYNLIVNLNRFGPNNLTTVFRSFIESRGEDTIILDYLKTVGDADYNGEFDLSNFAIEDIEILIAPVTPKNKIYNTKEKYIRVYNAETKRYDLYKYSEFRFDPDMEIDLDIESQGISNNYINVSKRTAAQDRDYYNYYILRSPQLSEKLQTLLLDIEDDIQTVKDKISNLMRRNSLQIDINCE